MTGRAGRRGQDKIGFMLAVSGRFMDLNHIRRLLFRAPEDILSQLKNDFAMVLNLLLSQTPEDVRKIFERSLAAYQQNTDGKQVNFRRQIPLGRFFAPFEIFAERRICG